MVRTHAVQTWPSQPLIRPLEDPLSDARHRAAARTLFNVDHGYAPEDTDAWGSTSLKVQQEYLARAEVLLPALDAADSRIRLSMPDFNAIMAQTVSDLSIDLRARFGADLPAEVAAFIDDRQEAYDHFLEPANHEQAMESLVLERLAAALNRTADFFDAASLDSITYEMDFETPLPPRIQRKMINGCAEWLREHARELTSVRARPYYRVNTQAVIDQDRHEAVLRVVGELITRAESIASADGRHAAFLMAADLKKALEDVGASVPEGPAA